RPIWAQQGRGRPDQGGPTDELGQPRQERSPGPLTAQPGVDLLRQPLVELSVIPPASVTHPVPPLCGMPVPCPLTGAQPRAAPDASAAAAFRVPSMPFFKP